MKLVNRLSSSLDDLMIVAEHRVVQLPRWIVFNKDELWRDECVMPTFNQARKLLAKLE